MTVGVISGLGKSKTSEKKTIKCASIYFEGIYLMLAYAFSLANMAGKKVGSQPSLTTESVLNEAIDMYCRTAGIFSSLGCNWATRWNGSSAKNRPPETTPAGLSLLSEFMLLEAQMLAVVKAEKRGMTISTIIKLQRGVLEKFQAAKLSLKNAKGDWSDVFRLYIEEGALLYEALMLKKYAAHCHSEDKNGLAVACMARCYNIFTIELKSIKTPAWAKIHSESKDDLKQTLDTYIRINNHVTYDRIPSDEDMMAALPPATCLVDVKAYTLPQPAEVPEPTEEELAEAAAALELKNKGKGDKKDKDSKKEKDKDKDGDDDKEDKKKKSKSPPPKDDASENLEDAKSDESDKSKKSDDDVPKASVRNAFKSLLKVGKKDVE